MYIAAAILAGGKATRLGGAAKGLLAGRDGVSIVEHLIGELTAAGIAEIVISANDPAYYRAFNRPIIADRHRDIGPLGGIDAVMSSLAPHCDCIFLLPCDLPNITAAEILGLVAAYEKTPGRIVVARTCEGEQPLCAIVPTSVLPQIAAAIADGSYGVSRLWQALNAAEVQIADAARLTNINTPDDLRHWQESSGQTEEE